VKTFPSKTTFRIFLPIWSWWMHLCPKFARPRVSALQTKLILHLLRAMFVAAPVMDGMSGEAAGVSRRYPRNAWQDQEGNAAHGEHPSTHLERAPRALRA